ncbi:L,D-transpeptidase family protein [Desulfospira joergensenii]|uniref:L,D-transpeptidase family protein n=1 Tax=Desulfospira joergensenii TaxID=53329 RepID=UPI0003B33457|nr:L,D-transpeptidase family protein [Desulfospira joergensenii]
MKVVFKYYYPSICFLILVLTLSAPFVCASAQRPENQPPSIIELPENENAILVEKESQMLYIYKAGQGFDRSLELVFSAPCSTGEVSGPKIEKGDKKTPEGIYFLIDEFEDKYLAPVYGKKAFPTDYPNFMDRRQGKNGSAIWIHGTDRALKPMDSNGCIALENENVMALSNYIRLDSTPLIIVDKIGQEESFRIKETRTRIMNLVSDWIKAIERGSYHEFLSFYAPSYVPDISWWEEWLKIRGRAVKLKKELRLNTSATGIYRHKDLYVVLMDFDLAWGEKKLNLGRRKLFFKSQEPGYKIVGDMFQMKNKTFAEAEVPLVVAALELISSQPSKEAALDTVRAWLAAWSAKDMDAYGAFYVPGFRSEGMSKKAWIRRKKALSKRYAYIRVTGENFKISKKKDGLEVTFMQNYESSGFSTKGVKQLKLVNKGGSWKISQENWKGK